LKTDGGVWGWGDDTYGQNGTGLARADPWPVSVDAGVLAVVTGLNYTLLLLSDGTLRGLGTGSSAHFNSATPVDAFDLVQVAPGLRFRSVSAGAYHVLGVDLDGGLVGWGDNGSGELGVGSPPQIVSPRSIGPGYRVAVAPDYRGTWSLALKTDGTLWGWGSNDAGQLALPNMSVPTPTQIP
jgi:alpha-tubulin suppressor-like RCC1 family protein